MAARQSDLKSLIDKEKKGVRLFSAANSNFDLILTSYTKRGNSATAICILKLQRDYKSCRKFLCLP